MRTFAIKIKENQVTSLKRDDRRPNRKWNNPESWNPLYIFRADDDPRGKNDVRNDLTPNTWLNTRYWRD